MKAVLVWSSEKMTTVRIVCCGHNGSIMNLVKRTCIQGEKWTNYIRTKISISIWLGRGPCLTFLISVALIGEGLEERFHFQKTSLPSSPAATRCILSSRPFEKKICKVTNTHLIVHQGTTWCANIARRGFEFGEWSFSALFDSTVFHNRTWPSTPLKRRCYCQD